MSTRTPVPGNFAFPLPDEPSIVELGFFVHRHELAKVEAAARSAGLTVAQLVRRLICDFLRGPIASN